MRFGMAVASAGLVAVLAATGCSGGGGAKVATLANGATSASDSSSDSSVSKQSFEDAMVSYTACMREHGVELPDPTFVDGADGPGFAVVNGTSSDGGERGTNGGPDDPAFRAADEACQSILDEVTKDLPKPSPEELAEQRDKALAFAKCMREHGVDMPDPTFDDNGGISIQIGSPDGDGATGDGPDPAIQEASKVCEPPGGPGPLTATGGGPNSGPVIGIGVAPASS